MVIRFSLPLTGGANRETVAGTPITHAVYISQGQIFKLQHFLLNIKSY